MGRPGKVIACTIVFHDVPGFAVCLELPVIDPQCPVAECFRKSQIVGGDDHCAFRISLAHQNFFAFDPEILVACRQRFIHEENVVPGLSSASTRKSWVIPVESS